MLDISKIWKGAIWFVFGMVLAGILGYSWVVAEATKWIFASVPIMNRNLAYVPPEARGVFLLAIVAAFWMVVSSYLQ